MHLIPPELAPNVQFRRGIGCKECLFTGYSGRTALTELMVADEVLREAILQKMTTRALQDIAIKQGMRTLWQTGLQRVATGLTTVEEILRVVAVDQL
jgi:type II secretory ATPase GspE/PulE/Tfp pilus assembly ATPase PilB-like protein